MRYGKICAVNRLQTDKTAPVISLPNSVSLLTICMGLKYKCTHTNKCIHTHKHVHTKLQKHTNKCTYSHTHIQADTNTHTNVNTHTCKNIHTHTHAKTHTHTHKTHNTHTHSPVERPTFLKSDMRAALDWGRRVEWGRPVDDSTSSCSHWKRASKPCQR